MLKKVLAIAALGVAVSVAPASAAVCYDIQAHANGQTLVSQQGCV